MRAGLILLLALLSAACAAGTKQPAERLRILYLTRSAGYVHEVVRRAAPETFSLAEQRLIAAAGNAFEIVATQDCRRINAETLRRFDAVAFYTSGELPIREEGRRALLAYVRGGGGFVGIHSATDTFHEYTPYGDLLGGYFDGHPWHQRVRVRVENTAHPATFHLGETFAIEDEIYQFRGWDRSKVHVLLSLDPESVNLNAKDVRRDDRDFALAWTKRYGRGRVFYTALGHRSEVWADERFLTHLLGGIRWVVQDSR